MTAHYYYRVYTDATTGGKPVRACELKEMTLRERLLQFLVNDVGWTELSRDRSGTNEKHCDKCEMHLTLDALKELK